MYSPARPESRQFLEMCRSSEWDLYWVSTQIRRYRALTRFDKTKSISRYAPPKGTAGLARSAVSGYSRLPSPPARTMPNTCGNSLMRQTYPSLTPATRVPVIWASSNARLLRRSSWSTTVGTYADARSEIADAGGDDDAGVSARGVR